MAKVYDVVAVTGKYTDRDGKEKRRYLTIGVVLETQNGLALKLEAVPVGWDGFAYLNEPRPKDAPREEPRQAPRAAAPAQDAPVPFDDDLPFK